MHFLGLSLLFAGYMFAVIGSFASFWPVALWVRSSITVWAKLSLAALPLFIVLLLLLSPLARRQALELGFSFSQVLVAGRWILAGLLSTYLFGFAAGKLSLRVDRWLLVTVPVWLLAVLAMTFCWALGFYYLAGAVDCSPGAYECP